MREALGLTQDEIAAKTNGLPWPVSRAAVSALEKGKHTPAATTILALCEVLRIDTMEVMDRLKLAAAPRRPIDNLDYGHLRLRFEGFFSTGDFRQALTVLDAMAMVAAEDRAVTSKERSRRLVALDISRATTLKRLGAIVASKASAERALERSADYPELRSTAYVALSEAQLRLGNLQMGIDAAERAVEHCASCDEAIQGRAWNARGRALWEGGRYEEARNAFVGARERATTAKDLDNLVHYEGNIGICLLELGHPKQARISVLRAVELAREIERPALEAIWLVEMARVALADGNWEEAERNANAAIHIAQRGDQWLTIFRATMVKHRAARGRNPIDPDRHNISYLERLLGWVEGDASDRDIRDFRKELLALHDSNEAEDA